MSLDKSATSGLKPKEKLCSTSFSELYLSLTGKLSYREAADTLNRLLHRGNGEKVQATTLENRVDSTGKKLSAAYMDKAESILETYNIDKHTGIISPESSIPESVRSPELPAVLSEKEVRKLITTYNHGRDSMTKLKYGPCTSNIEASTERCCYIRIDDIGVKSQKPIRKGNYKKDRRYIENTVIHIQADEGQYTLTAIGMAKALKMLVAFLLKSRLMEDRRLIFFSDGARNIRDLIDKYFGFRQYTLILDWLHLEKKCYEFLSMSIKGTKAEKEQIKKELVSILWTGRHDKAIKYLDAVKTANIKNIKKLDEFKAYILRKAPNMTCYALRHMLGLSISSSRVEKANDIIVATRQKHNGMSWSTDGSGALAVIKACMVNGELSGWIRNKEINFDLVA